MPTRSLLSCAGLVLMLVVGAFIGFFVNAGSSSLGHYVLAAEARQGTSDQVVSHIEQGTAEFSRGNYEEAIRHYSEALKLDPNNVNAYNNRGVAYSRIGKNDLAIRDFTRSVELNPRFAEAYNNRSMSYLREKDYARACADLKQYSRMGGKPSPEFAKELESKPGGRC